MRLDIDEVAISGQRRPGVVAEATIKNHAAFIWSVADMPRGGYKRSEYGKVILPLVVLRRLDCVLEPTKVKVLTEHERHGDREGVSPLQEHCHAPIRAAVTEQLDIAREIAGEAS